jgi:hypothetical protein
MFVLSEMDAGNAVSAFATPGESEWDLISRQPFLRSGVRVKQFENKMIDADVSGCSHSAFLPSALMLPRKFSAEIERWKGQQLEGKIELFSISSLGIESLFSIPIEIAATRSLKIDRHVIAKQFGKFAGAARCTYFLSLRWD